MIIFLDTETTGLSTDYCSLLEIAAIGVDATTHEILTTFHEYIKPSYPIPAKIVELTRITDEQVRYCRSEPEVLKDFTGWINGNGGTRVIAHNAAFDLRFLRDRSDKYNIVHPFYNIEVIDSMKIAAELIKSKKLATELTPSGKPSKKQESIAKALDIEYGSGGAHSAIEDVTVLMRMFYKMLEMR